MISSTEYETRSAERRQRFLKMFEKDVADMRAAYDETVEDCKTDLVNDPAAQDLEGLRQVAAENIVSGAFESAVFSEVPELLFGIAAGPNQAEAVAHVTLLSVMDALDAAEAVSQCLATIYDAVVEKLPVAEDGGFEFPSLDVFDATNKILAAVGRTEADTVVDL